MTKQSGLGDQLLISGYDLGEDIGSVGNIAGGNSPLNFTPITKSAFVRQGGQRDGTIEYTAFFNPSTGRSHDRLSALPTGDQLVTYLRGTGLGSPGACLNSKQIGYNGSRGDDGSFTFAVTAQANGYGLEWGEQLTDGVRADSAATNGTGVDFGTGSTTFGAQFYLHVTAFTGTTATVKVQESSDNGAVDPWTDVTGGSFTAVAAGPTWERLETARGQTVERYLRVATSGTFSALSLLVVAVRNPVEVTF